MIPTPRFESKEVTEVAIDSSADGLLVSEKVLHDIRVLLECFSAHFTLRLMDQRH